MGRPIHERLAKFLEKGQHEAPSLPQNIRNPWKGISLWKEFKWDVTHPGKMHRRAMLGIKGENPELPEVWRWLGLAMISLGAIYFMAGLTVVVLSYTLWA